MLKGALYRPIWLPAAIATVFLLIALGLLMGTAWRSVQRLQPVQIHIVQLTRLQQAALRIQELLVTQLSAETPITRGEVEALRAEVGAISQLENHVHADTPVGLRHVLKALEGAEQNPKSALIVALARIRQVLDLETRAHAALLSKVDDAAQFELYLAAGTIVALPLLVIAILFMIRKRIADPVRDVGRLMTLLADRDYRVAPIAGADPILSPLLENYNHLVRRLAELEHEHQARHQSLESQVRTATRALLEQQRSLATAERLAAVGELAATLAHELRNPIAGMQVALMNLRKEVDEPDHVERLGLVVDELNRVNALLNSLLGQARQRPEPARQLRLAENVEQLVKLVRYQMPEGIRISADVPADLVCLLPPDALHQALLNLILNAANAIGEAPGEIRMVARRNEDMLSIEVCDDGPGFSPDQLRTGIRPFATGHEGGIGLGLSIVRRFVRDADGTVKLHNADPKGACVTITLPCDEMDGRKTTNH